MKKTEIYLQLQIKNRFVVATSAFKVTKGQVHINNTPDSTTNTEMQTCSNANQQKNKQEILNKKSGH